MNADAKSKARPRKTAEQRAISIALNALESGNPGIAYNALSAVAKR